MNVVKQFFRSMLVASLFVGSLGYSQTFNVPGGQSSGAKNNAHENYCTSTSSKDEKEDCLRNTARSLSVQGVKDIKITNSRYFDSQGRRCPRGRGPILNRARVIFFLNNSIPVSQIAVMNYYGQHGECVSDSVKITLSDSKVVNFSLSSEGKVAYLSPVVGGRETDVFFYYCESCSK